LSVITRIVFGMMWLSGKSQTLTNILHCVERERRTPH
jgi:hypothetical protein